MIRYHYFYDPLNSLFYSNYYLSNRIDKQYIDTNNDNITLSLTFDPIQLKYQNELYFSIKEIIFYISGLLYKKIENSEESIDTTSILQRKPSYENRTINIFHEKYEDNFTLTFKNIPRNENFVYDLQIQAYSSIEYYNKHLEEFLIFTREIDLRDIKLEEKKSILWYILGPVLGFVFLLIVAFFVIKYIRLQKANINLREDLKSIAYSKEIQKNVLSKEKKDSEKESDYDTTFI